MNEPVRQHWVPKVYLRQFAINNSTNQADHQVNVYDLQSKNQFTTSINNIAVKKHLYTIGRNESEKLYVVENVLSLIETKVKPYLIELSNGINVQKNRNARYILSIFIATLISRNPRMVDLLNELKRSDHPLRAKLDKEGKEWLNKQNNEGMQILFNRSILWSVKPLAKDISGMKWCLIHSSLGKFITTDNPVCVFNQSNESWGIATLDTNIHLSISPYYMLLIGLDIPVKENITYVLPSEGVTGFNSVIISQAENYLISSYTFEGMESFIHECRN